MRCFVLATRLVLVLPDVGRRRARHDDVRPAHGHFRGGNFLRDEALLERGANRVSQDQRVPVGGQVLIQAVVVGHQAIRSKREWGEEGTGLNTRDDKRKAVLCIMHDPRQAGAHTHKWGK